MTILALTFTTGAMLAAPPVRADAVEDFYKGKNGQSLVGYSPGGGYDVYDRLLSRHVGRFQPDNPTMDVQNMPGAISLCLAN